MIYIYKYGNSGSYIFQFPILPCLVLVKFIIQSGLYLISWHGNNVWVSFSCRQITISAILSLYFHSFQLMSVMKYVFRLDVRSIVIYDKVPLIFIAIWHEGPLWSTHTICRNSSYTLMSRTSVCKFQTIDLLHHMLIGSCNYNTEHKHKKGSYKVAP